MQKISLKKFVKEINIKKLLNITDYHNLKVGQIITYLDIMKG